ncbi:hypothetical protein HOE22_12705 [Candidatus Woesearchaeota archaeon]|jgi:hypothetical protein|nr:hypothetical protein [Candidatus Woesearchaeota archaeon]MBT7557242.1 hypothetical protein [Candidatus Woesearchaeota archaeon]
MKKVALCVTNGVNISNILKKFDKFNIRVFQLHPYSKESILTEFKKHYTIDWEKSPPFTDDIILKYYELMVKSNMKRTYEISKNFVYDICVDVKSNIQIKRDLNSIPNIKPNTIYIYDKIKPDKPGFLENYDDRIFYSDSICFDVMGTIFKNLLYFTEDINEKFIFMYFVNMFRFTNEKMWL